MGDGYVGLAAEAAAWKPKPDFSRTAFQFGDGLQLGGTSFFQ